MYDIFDRLCIRFHLASDYYWHISGGRDPFRTSEFPRNFSKYGIGNREPISISDETTGYCFNRFSPFQPREIQTDGQTGGRSIACCGCGYICRRALKMSIICFMSPKYAKGGGQKISLAAPPSKPWFVLPISYSAYQNGFVSWFTSGVVGS